MLFSQFFMYQLTGFYRSNLSFFFLSPLVPVLSPDFPSFPAPYSPPFQTIQASQQYQPDMTYQVVVRLCTSSPIKAGQGTPVKRKGSPKQVKESETAPVPIVRSPTGRPCYTTVRYVQRKQIPPVSALCLAVQAL